MESQDKEKESGKSRSYSFWSWRRKAPFVILCLALVAAIVYSVVITGDRNTLNTKLESVQGVLTTTQARLSKTQSDLEAAQADLVSTQADLSNVKNNLEATEKKLETTEAKLKLYKETLGIDVFSNIQSPIKKGGTLSSREYVTLIDNPTATNPTWQELMAFLRADPTDDKTYQEDSFNCTNFAEMLHNYAERKGIRAAFVDVHFEDDPVGHALNAFKTTDKGLVYVDCTGEGFQSRLDLHTIEKEYGPAGWDKIAYMVKGKEYGVIHIAEAGSLSYSFYEGYKQKWQECEKLVSDYNHEVMQFNQENKQYNESLTNYDYNVATYNRGCSEYNRLMSSEGEFIAKLYESTFFFQLRLDALVSGESPLEKAPPLKQRGNI